MRLVVILLGLVQFAAVVLLAAEHALSAGTSPASRFLGLALACVLPLAGPALWLAVQNRALPFALVLVLVLPAALPIVLLLR